MGDKRPSVRTLSTGEQVTHYPDGRQVLIPSNRVGKAMAEAEDHTEQVVAGALDRVREKRDRQRGAGRPVPTDKTPL